MTSDSLPPPPSRDGVEDHAHPTAEAFLDALAPRHALWCEAPTDWVFRGHRNALWELRPKAERDVGTFAHFGISIASLMPGYEPTGDYRERSGLIDRLLESFRIGLDRAGIVIPSPSPQVKKVERETFTPEPHPDLFPLMALAQHHGLPTLLLDWSRRAAVAAYFAAADAADPMMRGSATHLAVWAIFRGGRHRSAEGPHFYDAPGGTNPNLTAQSGLFSYHLAEDDPSLEQHWVRMMKWTGATTRLRRIHLPASQAPKLLRLLSYEGITGASMFPGADGVVRAMRESALWDIPAY